MCKFCRATDKEVTEIFMDVWDVSYTTEEEIYIDTEPDIRGPLRELDRRAAQEKRRHRGD